jgi:Tfp pilus assembly major pilin PilA
MKNIRTKQQGFGLFELIISLGIIGTLIAGVLVYQSRAEAAQTRSGVVTALTSMSSDIRSTFGSATNGNYNAVTTASIAQAGLVVSPFTTAGSGATSSVTTPWGGTVVAQGNTAFFALQMPVPDSATCQAIISRFGPSAERIVVAATAPTLGASTTATSVLLVPGTTGVVKESLSSTYNAANAATACASAPSPIVTIVWR